MLPSIEMLMRIADCFRVSTDYLLERVSDKQIAAEGLTEEQLAHVAQIVFDLVKANGR